STPSPFGHLPFQGRLSVVSFCGYITRLDVPCLYGGGLYRKKGGSLNLPPLGRLVEMLTYVVFSSGEEKT
ncbi:MAG: hypothetical protein J6O04_04570, partial [Selenomonadaceae bacterium]|nr:hypothetical protein [Selenomonadaceae bacterium]